jgi:hypothetical protein
MGGARIYVLAGAITLLVLAAVGFIHLLSSGPRIAQDPTTKALESKADVAPVKAALIAITEIGLSETRGGNGEKNVAVKIGVAPRPNIPKGEVEIRVAFFDLTETNEMRPTDAEVDYEWLTPVRDWTDPTPKYLVATYDAAGASRQRDGKLRYGGFVVRVFFNGQLQAERSEPKELMAALRNKATPSASRPPVVSSDAKIAPATPGPTISQASVHTSSTPAPLQANRESSSAIPYASPVPDKPGFVYSPHDPKFLIDVRGFPPGTEVNDPNTGKLFKVP